MTFLLSAWLVLAAGDFPEADDPDLVLDVADNDEPIVAPDEVDESANWRSKNVKPKDISPRAPIVEPKDTPKSLPPAQSEGTTTRSTSTQPARHDAPAAPSKPKGPTITGYHVGTWNDTKFSIQKQFADDKPMVERGGGKWMLQDTCESEKASVTFRFTAEDRLNQVVCQFRQGVENSNPDYPLYQKLRRRLAQRWGEPTSTNESPAPDSPSQAVEWFGEGARAVLLFDLENSSLQLTVESQP